MSAFGKVLGASLAVVLVAKVGLTVSYYSNERTSEQAQNIVNRINNNTSALAEPFSSLVAVKEVNSTGIVLNYTLKPNFVANMQQMVEADVRKNAKHALEAYARDGLNEMVNEGMTVVVKFRDESGQIVKDVTFSQGNLS